jgi:uncharacterized protein (TIGR02996 family)
MNEAAILDEILDHPDDVGVHEVYADWLEERGDPRAEFLRLARAQRTRRFGPARKRRLAELREMLDFAWLALVDREVGEEAIREAVFTHLLGEEAKPEQCFIEVEGHRDPSPLLLRRLQARFPGLRPRSEAEYDAQLGHFLDRESRDWCVLYRVDGIEWTDARNAVARGGYYMDPLAASGERYILTRERHTWTVVSSALIWVS